MEIVSGIQQFERAFSAFSDSFIVIGGSACRAVLSDGPIQPRRTRDIDMVLVLENVGNNFISAFWKFIKDGGYKFASRKNAEGEVKYVFYSFSPDFEGSRINGAFVANEDNFIDECGAQYWIYGHSHRNIDKQIGGTQFVCNQLGYVFAKEHYSFGPTRCIDL